MGDDDYDYLLKLIVIGDSGVGKSNLMTRYTTDDFSADAKPTIGVSFSTRAAEIDGKRVKLQIWDTAGQERYRALTGVYYRGAAGALIVYDLTSRQSFVNIPRWFEEIDRFCGDEKPLVVLVGNKLDLVQERCVQPDEAAEFARQHGISMMETSALDSTNVERAFTELARDIIGRKMQPGHAAVGGSGGAAPSRNDGEEIKIKPEDEFKSFKLPTKEEMQQAEKNGTANPPPPKSGCC